MALPPGIDFDQLIYALLDDMAKAVTGWASGLPMDEAALMNRITAKLSRKRRRCDVGVDSPVEMFGKFHLLHRQGTGQSDKFGSDLAVTIQIPRVQFTKTAFFQLKVSLGYSATLTVDQLAQAKVFPGVLERSFVLAVDQSRFGYRICATKNCLTAFPIGQGNRKFDVSTWEFLTAWLSAWFSCERGPPTDPKDPNPVELMLDKYRQATVQEIYDEAILANVQQGIFPAKSWLHFTFETNEGSAP
jgi:hypothetical protein